MESEKEKDGNKCGFQSLSFLCTASDERARFVQLVYKEQQHYSSMLAGSRGCDSKRERRRELRTASTASTATSALATTPAPMPQAKV